MYQAHFKLKKDPFGMTPDPFCLFRTASHQETLSGLTYAVLESKGVVTLTGEVGTGKTTMLSRVIRSIPNTRAMFSVVLSPTLTPDEFLEAVLTDFGLRGIPPTKIKRLTMLQQFLAEAHSNGRICVLVVDEAHKLSPELLEEIRLLSNFENAERKLLQIVLAGQTELRNLLNRDDLRQLKQRIALRFELHPLTMSEINLYMRFRWVSAGAEEDLPFDSGAIRAISVASRGLPRLINALCDNALILAFGSRSERVTEEHAMRAIRDLDLEPVAGNTPARNGAAHLPPDQAPAQIAAPEPLRLPPPAAVAGVVEPMRELRIFEQYTARERKPPLLMRWAGRLKLASVERHS